MRTTVCGVHSQTRPLKEDAMTKAQAALVTAILAVTTMLASTAEAGMKVRLGFGFPLGNFTAHGNSGGYSEPHRKSRRTYVRRKETSKVAKQKSTEAVAKAEPEAPVEPVEKVNAQSAQSENSSISTAAIASVGETPMDDIPVAAPEPDGKASVKKLDCKKFFPSVGMTLTVPCE
jgi:hypothetical protein